jgi:GTP cyclohydrolase I
MEQFFKDLLIKIGEDTTREGLVKTPQRAAKAFQYLTKGYTENLDEIVNNAIFQAESDDMVIVKDIELYSLCEHHLLPFIGKCHVGYIPKGKIIGLSKIARIVDHFARRLQVQERLTKQIADSLIHYTGADGVAVVIEAQHLCTMMRGVEKQNSVMTTSVMLGSFREDSATRAEFLSLVKR